MSGPAGSVCELIGGEAPTIADFRRAAAAELERCGIDTPWLDTEVVLCAALGRERSFLFANPDHRLHPQIADQARHAIERRALREPVAYILGRRSFRWLELTVDRRALIPRCETELLVEVALECAHGARVCDVGTGCGAVALAIKHERPDLHVTASDTDEAAIDLARENARGLGLDVDFRLAAGVPRGYYDLVVANLPYVTEAEWATLAAEITAYEPREALVGGADGLDAIRQAVATAAYGQLVAFEHAPGQARDVAALLQHPSRRRDLSGRDRVTVGRRPAQG